MKKLTYFITIFIVSSLLILLLAIFFTDKPNDSDYQFLKLTPYTAEEQKEILRAQEAEEQTLITGPLVPKMSVAEAEDKVLEK